MHQTGSTHGKMLILSRSTSTGPSEFSLVTRVIKPQNPLPGVCVPDGVDEKCSQDPIPPTLLSAK